MNREKIKQYQFLKKSVQGKNGSPILPEGSLFITDTSKVTEDQIMLQLKKMAELNANLEQLVEQRTNKLIEVIATNTKFISIITHDLRSPFCSILGGLEVIKQKLEPYKNEDIEEYINHAIASTHKTLNLLESLSEWAISQNAGKSFNPVKINLYNLLKEESESHSNQLKMKQITLHYFIAQNLNVSADLQMVKTILRNLITNAIKYSYTGGEITVSASESNQFVEITVKDTGIGISAEAQRKLFKTDKFHSTAGTNNEQGTGLGLLLCKEFVEMHGGKIHVESRPEKGSKFIFTLPHYI